MFSFSVSGLILLSVIGVLGWKFSKEINPGIFHPANASITFGEYVRDNKLLQKKSWGILRELSDNQSYGVKNNDFDEKKWFVQPDKRRNILVVGNSHSKDVFNILFNSETVQSKYQVARYGAQISDLSSSYSLWNSPNYHASDYVIIASRINVNDVEKLKYVLDRIIQENKTPIVVKNIFEFSGEASGFSLIDVVVQNSFKSSMTLSGTVLRVNRAYFEYYLEERDADKGSDINKMVERISEAAGAKTLNRMDYVCNNETKICSAVEQNLSKNYYDRGHHTLSGAKFFSQRVDEIDWLKLGE